MLEREQEWEGTWERLKEEKERGKLYNYIIISKNKKILRLHMKQYSVM